MEGAAAAIQVLFAAAVVLVAMRSRHRHTGFCPIFCFVSLSIVGLVTFGFAAYRAPGWLVLVGGASTTAIFVTWFATLLGQPRSDGDDDGGGFGGGGGGPQPPSPGGGEPWWWGDFERQLRAYMRSRQPDAARRVRGRRRVALHGR
jgi:hypothetical protein